MTARRSAYGEALRRAGGLTTGPAEDDGGSVVAAEPRPRSRFEQSWDEPGSGPVPAPTDFEVMGLAVAHAVPDRPWVGPVADPPAVGGVRSEPPGPRAEQPLDVAPGPQTPGTDSHPQEDAGVAARAARPVAALPTARATAVAEAEGSAAPPPSPPSALPASALPVSPIPPATRTSSADHAAAPRAEADDALPVQASSAAPLFEPPLAGAAGAMVEVVRAEPLPVETDHVMTSAANRAEPVPVVVEIGRIEVRIVADLPTRPSSASERRPRPRTGPTLAEYLASGTVGAAGREEPS
ncbi:hypothetical protein [Kitasatospora cinereorecta]|uniref:Uncharacterized protein n=1 Tax=Kitasatospora cinereorecta TaxID=285560 RepID=A0ABW0VIB3_9ACTN